MIIDNAIIYSQKTGKPDIDSETGYPNERYSYYGRMRIYCQIRPLSQDLLARAGSGLPIEATIYEVLIDAADWKQFEESSIVQIYFHSGKNFDAQVISTEYLQAVNQYKLICRYK